VTSLIDLYNLQKDFVATSDLDQVLARIMQAAADDTCAWVSLTSDKVTSQKLILCLISFPAKNKDRHTLGTIL